MALTLDQSRHLANEYRDLSYEGLSFASRRTGELSDDFARLQVQIAGMLFVFSGLFLGYLGNAPILAMRISFAVALFCLIASLVSGLLHLKKKEFYWNATAKGRGIRLNRWQEATDREGSFEEAFAFHTGATEAIATFKASFPLTWIAQTAFLGIAIAILFALAIVFIFS